MKSDRSAPTKLRRLTKLTKLTKLPLKLSEFRHRLFRIGESEPLNILSIIIIILLDIFILITIHD